MKGKFIKNLLIVLVFFFLFLPIIVLIFYSFNSSKMNIIFEGFTFDWYKTLFKNKELLEAFKNTIIIALTSSIISTIVGTISAYGLYKYNFKLKNFVNKLIYIPIVIPEIVLGISFLSIYTLSKLQLGMFSIVLSHIAFSIPFVIVSVRSTFDDQTIFYEEAAKDLGASNFTVFTRIIVPIIKSGIISGFALVFTLSLDDVVISYFAAGPDSNTLPLYIYSIIKTGITPDVNALSTIILLFTLFAMLFITLIQIKNQEKKYGKN